MTYFRCKCGQVEGANTGEPIPPCITCAACGSTLAARPSGHVTPAPHDLRGRWRVENDAPVYVRECTRFGCSHREAVPRDEWPAF